MGAIDLARLPDETELGYIWRLGKAKEDGLLEMTWTQLAEVLNRNLRDPDEYFTESAFRKKYAIVKQAAEEIFAEQVYGSQEELEDLKNRRHELYKERVKLCDERRELNAYLRAEAREERFIEQIEQIFADYKYEPVDCSYLFYPKIDGDVDLLIPLTDLHAGIVIDNTWNKFDYDVLKDRLFSYAFQIREIQQRHKAKRAYIVGSEFISGIIHSTLRLESNDNVIQQFIKCMNLVIWFLI